MEEILKIIAIKTDKCVYLSDNVDNDNYHRNKIDKLSFDGKLPKKTYEKYWFEIEQIPLDVTRTIQGQQINKRYVLKDEFSTLNLDKTKEIDFFRCKNDCYDCDCENTKLKIFYDYEYEISEPTSEEVKFEITVIDEINNFEIVKQEFNLNFNLIDRLKFNPVCLPLKPCFLSKNESYAIIRNHIKNNIDSKYAAITSDYDLCLTVKKKIKMHEIEEYFVDVNNSFFQKRKRKPLMEKRYIKNREVVIFKIAPKEYQKYPIVKEFTGENANDLNNNVKKYLDELMQEINSPLIDCPHCCGEGVILEKQS